MKPINYQFLSPISWVGGKAKNIKHILKYIPDKIHNYYEPFMGGFSIGLRLLADKIILGSWSGNDVNYNLIKFWIGVRKGWSMIKLVELFGGIGSFRKSLENLRYEVDCTYIDNDKHAVKAYNILFNENEKPIDIKEYSYKEDKKIDILTAGFPCQDISQAGKRDLNKGRSLLYKEIFRIIREITDKNRPNYVILENSYKIYDNCNIEIKEDIRLSFKILGYEVYFLEFDSWDFGLPMTRKRAIIIAYLKHNNFNKTLRKIIHNLEFHKKNKLNEFLNDGYLPILANYKIEEANNYDFSRSGAINGFIVPKNKSKNSCYYRIYNPSTQILGSIRSSYRTKIYLNHSTTEIIIRKLGADEMFRLFGWTDPNYWQLEKSMSESRLWKLIANSIVLPMLEAIFPEFLAN